MQGFTSQGQRICVDTSNQSRVITPTDIVYGTSNIPRLSIPNQEVQGGEFQSYFTNMFIDCPPNKGIIGFQPNGTPKCADIPVDITCAPITVAPFGGLPQTPINGVCSCDV